MQGAETIRSATDYINARKLEAQRIRTKYAKTNTIIYSKTDNWVRIDNETFNGWSRKEVDNLLGIKGGE